MQPAQLVFLEDARARRLAVAWAACQGDEKTWAEMAGFARSTPGLAPLMTCLQANGICRPGGQVDELALKYIGALASKSLPRKK